MPKKVTATRSTGDFVLYRPRHNLRIVGIVGSIGKISPANRRGPSSRFPHISHCHGAGTVCIYAEGETGHQALFSGPQSGLVEVVGGFNKELAAVGSGEPLAHHRRVKI